MKMTILELVDECISELGTVRTSIDEQETVALPVRRTRDKLIALKKFFEEQNKTPPTEENKE